MTMKDRRFPDPTRRHLLTSVGVAGVGAYGFLRLRGASTATPPDQYTNYTIADTDGPRLIVGWYSTYNGALLSGSPLDDTEWDANATDSYVDDVATVLADDPAVDVDNLLPGDSGTLSIGLFADSEPVRVWARLGSTDSGPLSEAVSIEAWYDTGIFGVGGCQGAEAGPSFDPITDSGATLADPGALVDGVEINPGAFDNGVLEAGQRVCVALAWKLPETAGNELQNTAVGFDLQFAAVAADGIDAGTNPFAEGP